MKSCSAQVTVLEWDQSGHYLLIGDTAGNAEIWTTLSHLLNEWTRVANICIPDEPIQAGIFFFNGKKVSLNQYNFAIKLGTIQILIISFRLYSTAKIEKVHLISINILN